MLASRARLRASEDFRATVRQGVRAARPSVVVHLRDPHSPLDSASPADDSPTRVGFVVSKAVGGAVTRNRVKRQLRHLARPLVEARPTGRQVVVRALPAAATSTALADDLRGAWRAAEARLAKHERPAAAQQQRVAGRPERASDKVGWQSRADSETCA